MKRKIPGMKWIYRDDITGELWLRVQGFNTPHDEETDWVDDWVPVHGEIAEAVALRERLCHDLAHGKYDSTRVLKAAPTLGQLADDLAKMKGTAGRRMSTIKGFELYCAKWSDQLGHINVALVDYHDTSTWWAEIQKRETARTANCALITLRATIEHGIRIGYRKSGNPAKALLKARAPRKLERPNLSIEKFREITAEIDKLESDAIQRGRPYMGHVAYCYTQVALACRGDEVCGLTWEAVDMERLTVTLYDTKTAPSERRFVTQQFIDSLEHHHRMMKQFSPPTMAASEYVFPLTDGTRSSGNRIRALWYEGVKNAGYVVGQRNNGLVPHDMRRLGIELLYLAGGSQRDVMQWVGHHTATAHAMYLQHDAERLTRLSESVSLTLFERQDRPDLHGHSQK